MTLYLLGFMGAGKTTVGRRLARRLERRFVDLDREIERRTERSIPELFAELGEAGFRDRESEALRSLELTDRPVVATGGGVVVREENLEIMDRRGVTVWLDAPFDLLCARVTASATERPLFADPSSARALFDERVPSYRRARIRVEIRPDDEVDAVAGRIVDGLEAIDCAS